MIEKQQNKENIELVKRGTAETIDPFLSAPPGISLTSPVEKWPWGQPSKNVDPNIVLEESLDRLDDPIFKNEMMKLLLAGISIEHLVEAWVIDGFENGKFPLDVGLLLKGDLAMAIAHNAEMEEIPYRMFQNENILEEDALDNKTYFNIMKTNNPKMFSNLRENLNKMYREGMNPNRKENK